MRRISWIDQRIRNEAWWAGEVFTLVEVTGALVEAAPTPIVKGRAKELDVSRTQDSVSRRRQTAADAPDGTGSKALPDLKRRTGQRQPSYACRSWQLCVRDPRQST
jgi:hypothetical protein